MIGSSELIVVLLLAFFLFGPKKLPEMMRSMGRAVGEYQKALKDFERETQLAALGGGVPPKELSKAKEETSPELIEIARNLGIEVEGKPRDQILKEIKEKTDRKEEARPKKKKLEKPPLAE